jgi:opacity protein-like surface antigen
MRQGLHRYALALFGALAVSATASSAQTTDRISEPPAPKRVDVTPFVAMGDDLAPGMGAAFTFAWTRTLSVEAEASLGTDAGRTSLSLLYTMPKLGRFAPYVAGGAGFQRDELETYTGVSFATRKKAELAVNIGAGVTIPVSDRWAWRADFRWYNPKAEWPESWRVYNGLTVALRH